MAYLLLDLMPWVTAVPFRKVVVDFKYLHTFQMWKFLLRKTEHLPVLHVCNETSFEKAEPFFTRVLWDWTDLLTRAYSLFLSWLAFAPCLWGRCTREARTLSKGLWAVGALGALSTGARSLREYGACWAARARGAPAAAQPYFESLMQTAVTSGNAVAGFHRIPADPRRQPRSGGAFIAPAGVTGPGCRSFCYRALRARGAAAAADGAAGRSAAGAPPAPPGRRPLRDEARGCGGRGARAPSRGRCAGVSRGQGRGRAGAAGARGGRQRSRGSVRGRASL